MLVKLVLPHAETLFVDTLQLLVAGQHASCPIIYAIFLTLVLVITVSIRTHTFAD